MTLRMEGDKETAKRDTQGDARDGRDPEVPSSPGVCAAAGPGHRRPGDSDVLFAAAPEGQRETKGDRTRQS